MSTALCIMAKVPEPGRVKTRLTPPLSPAEASELAAAMLLDTWQVAHALGDAQVLLLYAGERVRLPAALRDAGDALVQQRGDDLGARIEHAARTGLGRRERVLVIGSDLPGLPLALLRAARDALARDDAVLGPSGDGGFYLIGLRRCPPDLLAGLPWSAPQTYAACAARLSERGLRVARLAEFDDVDEIDDLRRVQRALAAGQTSAPATARALETLSCV
ncbi:TIGR04282 family arsenosugar biosynthesis glycosyltransferase [Haliangium ochraceum]|uniref:Glycosyltransferase n=1 Tax=Haliangium ochraceum (strain DSM 14365 / JCM 11303 / SMP-2) TaxID=502025 RepID=D0LQ39_HALO1|nr:TIGR04282 family arsenosugar biosynthesis glycosyltransferase [Haliangium ochraceum]ACY17076.1 Protein of unknown function DUF2064 [Haliangium ochraceum DSM 14365]